jgi:hypothetical protein
MEVVMLNKIVTYCFNRFEVHVTFAGMTVENPNWRRDRFLATFWYNAAMAVAVLRGNHFT